MKKLLGRGRLGILGGMGSEATAFFLRRLAQLSPVTSDQHHIPFLLLSCPEIPDRSEAIEIKNDLVPTLIQDYLQLLVDEGCEAIAIPCNTAHYWRHYFASSLRIPLLDIVSATAKRAKVMGAKNAVVLGTSSTIKYRLYHTALREYNIHHIDIPDKMIDLASSVITYAKSGELEYSSQQLDELLRLSRSLNPDVVILGCTELPMVLRSELKDEGLIDSVTCLAESCIDWWYSRSMLHK